MNTELEFAPDCWEKHLTFKTVQEPTIIRNVQSLDFGNEIRSKAISIIEDRMNQTPGQVLKGNRKKALIFWAIFEAHMALGHPTDVKSLLAKLKYPAAVANLAVRSFLSEGVTMIDPVKLSMTFLARLKVSEDIRIADDVFRKRMEDLYNTIRSSQEGQIYFETTDATKTCIGMVHYLLMKGYKNGIREAALEEISQNRRNVIRQHSDRIEELYNGVHMQ